MSGTYVTDITHYLDDSGELVADMPRAARQLSSFLVLLIDSATEGFPVHNRDTGIRCRSKGCSGSIRASLAYMDDEISWHCPVCDHHGVIRNWQGTKWNQKAKANT